MRKYQTPVIFHFGHFGHASCASCSPSIALTAGACRAAAPQRRDGASQPVVLQMEHVQSPKPDKGDRNLAGDLVPGEVNDSW
jgi:hypothetical protein